MCTALSCAIAVLLITHKYLQAHFCFILFAVSVRLRQTVVTLLRVILLCNIWL